MSRDTPLPYSPDTICWTLFRYTWLICENADLLEPVSLRSGSEGFWFSARTVPPGKGFLKFPNAGVLNAVGRRNTQKSARESKRKAAKERKRAQKGAKERKRALPRKKCKQPGLKQPGWGTPEVSSVRISVHSYEKAALLVSVPAKAVPPVPVFGSDSVPALHASRQTPEALKISKSLKSDLRFPAQEGLRDPEVENLCTQRTQPYKKIRMENSPCVVDSLCVVNCYREDLWADAISWFWGMCQGSVTGGFQTVVRVLSRGHISLPPF